MAAPAHPTTTGVIALGDDRDATLALARELAAGNVAESVIAHIALDGQDRHFTAALRVTGPADALAAAVAPIASHGAWRAHFRHVKACPRTWPLGEPGPGVGAVFGVWRNPKLDHAAFDRHWRDIHAPLALRHHVAMWDYVQCSLDAPVTPDAVDYDGVAICQFPTLEDLRERFFDGPEGERVIAKDAATFGDPERITRALMREYVLRA